MKKLRVTLVWSMQLWITQGMSDFLQRYAPPGPIISWYDTPNQTAHVSDKLFLFNKYGYEVRRQTILMTYTKQLSVYVWNNTSVPHTVQPAIILETVTSATERRWVAINILITSLHKFPKIWVNLILHQRKCAAVDQLLSINLVLQ